MYKLTGKCFSITISGETIDCIYEFTNCYLSQSYAVAKKDLKEFTKDHASKNDDKTIKAGVLYFALTS